MPFTLSHPALVVAVPQHKYLHKPALITGSLSPDFIYFLYGQPTQGVGHSIMGTFFVNLPLSMLFYVIYLKLIAPYFWQYLPKFIRIDTNESNPFNHIQSTFIFAISVVIGSFSHIVWDKFTHKGSDIVNGVALLHSTFHNIPVYKILQHTSSLGGLLFILCFMLYYRQRHPMYTAIQTTKQLIYWLFVVFFAFTGLSIWQICHPLDLMQSNRDVVVLIVRVVDVLIMGLLITGIIFQLKTSKDIKNNSEIA